LLHRSDKAPTAAPSEQFLGQTFHMQLDSGFVMFTNIRENIEHELAARSRTSTLAATIDNVKRTCFELANSPDCSVKINVTRLNSFINSLDIKEIKRSSHLMDNPIEFRDEFSEINFHMTLHLFNFGHGFRHPLHQICGCGAWQAMKKGILRLHLNASKGFIDAEALIGLSVEKVNDYFQFPALDSSDYGQKLNLLRDMILQVAHCTGARLVELGYASFTDFIFDHSSGTQPSATKLVENLADHFPAFDDRRCLSSGNEVLFLKKAQIAIAELFQKLGNALSRTISFEDVYQFTVACDNVLPCVLRTLGIIAINPDLENRINSKQFLPAGDEEAHLRASAISVTEMILKSAKGTFWAKELGDYLWTLGKEPRFRKVERHATIETCFY